MQTTLNKIREVDALAESSYAELLKHLNKTEADDEPLDLLTILESNGFDDTIWCFNAVDGYEKEKRLFGVYCARQVEYLMKDPRSLIALDMSERYANGEASLVDIIKARVDASIAASMKTDVNEQYAAHSAKFASYVYDNSYNIRNCCAAASIAANLTELNEEFIDPRTNQIKALTELLTN